MKVAIINITGGGISGGYRQYLRNVIPRMAAHSDVESILCAAPESLNIQDWFDSAANVRFVNCKSFRFLSPLHDHKLLEELKSFHPHVIFVPVERYLNFKEIPVVNMFRNMEPFASTVDENSLLDKLRHWAHRLNGKRAVKNAHRVIAISTFVSDLLVMNWKIPKDRVGLVYHGIDVKEAKDGQRPDIILDGWDNKFIFTAGSICPARGLRDIIQAMKELSRQGGEPVRLVIAGETGQRMARYHKKLKDLAKKNNLLDRICWASWLNEKEMAWCYKNCNAFVMTSRVEACPNIVLEAMAHGCVCVSTETSPMPEFFKNAAIFYPPKDARSLARAIKDVLSLDDNQRKIMSEKARRQAARFSWDFCAEKTVAELAKALK